MNQTEFEQLVSDIHDELSGTMELNITPGRPDLPIVILVHGIGGSAQQWADPIGLAVSDTWLYDTSSQPNPQTGFIGVTTSSPYRPNAVRNWCQVLTDERITCINFSQSQPSGPLSVATADLLNVLTAAENQLHGVSGADDSKPPLVLLCHSRGGLIARQVLKQLGHNGVPHLARVISLCTPHQGSYVPALARDYDSLVRGKLDLASLAPLTGPFSTLMRGSLDAALNDLDILLGQALGHTFGVLASGEGFDELLPGSPMLQQLADGELPLAGVTYHAFGGSAPGVVTFYLSVASALLPLLMVSSPELIDLLDRCVPRLRSGYGGLVEFEQGDSAVSLTSSHWPATFNATYAALPINHMQALIDRSLQSAVLDLLTV